MSNSSTNSPLTYYQTCSDYTAWLYSVSDPRVASWPLMSSHWPVLAIICGYLAFLKYAPKWMKQRDAFKLNNTMIVYNLGIACLNLYICKETYLAATNLGYSYVCQKVVYSLHPEEIRMAKAIWWFFMSKIVELTDTVFLIARKKTNQLSFLHIYHHDTIMLPWSCSGGSAPNGWLEVPPFFPAMTNSAVHVLMYSYYGLAAFGPTIRAFLWWKPYLTQIQMMQFVAGLYFGVQSFYVTCEFPLWMKCAFIAYMASLLALFANFYNRKYKKQTNDQNRAK